MLLQLCGSQADPAAFISSMQNDRTCGSLTSASEPVILSDNQVYTRRISRVTIWQHKYYVGTYLHVKSGLKQLSFVWIHILGEIFFTFFMESMNKV